MPAPTTHRVTLECAGNGRALMDPRPVSQPWLTEAVGTAEWTGTPLAPLLQEAGLAPTAVEVVFTGADHGIERGVEQDYHGAAGRGGGHTRVDEGAPVVDLISSASNPLLKRIRPAVGDGVQAQHDRVASRV